VSAGTHCLAVCDIWSCNSTVLQVYSLAQQNRFYKKAAGYCLRAVAK
jgi:hypothetical protein